EILLQDLQRRFPSRTMFRLYWLPLIAAQIALAKDQPLDAINALRAAEPVELGVPLSTQGPPCLYPVFVRGQAYLAAHQAAAAAAEFQKLLAHRGITWACPTGALAHLGLARSYALAGDAAKSRAAYRDFFSLWKDADVGIPILTKARSESSALPQ